MSISKENIIDSLRNVNHPVAATDIVSLNMVQNVEVEENKISLTLVFSKANDPFVNSIKKACTKVLQAAFGDVELVITEQLPMRKLAPEYAGLAGVKNIIAVASGKGGVGKSTVAVNLAIAISHTGAKVALLDADIYGPSAPKMFGAEDFKPVTRELNGAEVIVPLEKFGIKIQSAGFFVNQDEALVWRGPMASNALKQIITQTDWGELDYLLIDLPPGTGDIHLTLVQEMPINGAVIVSTPQQVALADVIKGINMFRGDKINVPVLGIVENMAWFTPDELPDNKYFIFGKDGCKKLAEEFNVPLLGQIPLVQGICESGDKGKPIAMNPFKPDGKAFANLAEKVMEELERRNQNLPPTQKVEIVKH